LIAPEARHIDMTEFDPVQVKWEGSTSSKQMKGTLIISKIVIKDKGFLEWLANRELYEMWEKEQVKASRSAKGKAARISCEEEYGGAAAGG